MWSSPTRYISLEIWCTNLEEIDLHVHGVKFHGSFAVELMIHFLEEECFLNIHSAILFNLPHGV